MEDGREGTILGTWEMSWTGIHIRKGFAGGLVNWKSEYKRECSCGQE